MGHLGTGVYHKLQHRLDRYPVGAPKSKDLIELLSLLFSEEEAELAARMPIAPETLEVLSRRLGIEAPRLRDKFEVMAGKGLVMDFDNPKNGKMYYMLSPTVVGFFEFSLMRVRDDIPQKKIAEAMSRYIYGDDAFAKDAFQAETQLGRTLVHETALKGEPTEILDYEKASALISESKNQALSLCYCRHKKKLMGEECEYPLGICTSINTGADYLVRRKLARQSSREELLDILDQTYEQGLVNIADNVQREVSFICHCCSCCCGMLQSIKRFSLPNAVMTSNHVARVHRSHCRGCKKCVDRCPIGAIKVKVIKRSDRKKKYRWAEVDPSACLGCGVCVAACDKQNAIEMEARKQRVIPPEGVLERVLTMALERGKLHEFLFDGEKPPIPQSMHGLVKAALTLPPTKQLLLQKQIKSKFIQFLVEKAT